MDQPDGHRAGLARRLRKAAARRSKPVSRHPAQSPNAPKNPPLPPAGPTHARKVLNERTLSIAMFGVATVGVEGHAGDLTR
eukprot:9055659-Pyramimonas_sp.AAC.2